MSNLQNALNATKTRLFLTGGLLGVRGVPTW